MLAKLGVDVYKRQQESVIVYYHRGILSCGGTQTSLPSPFDFISDSILHTTVLFVRYAGASVVSFLSSTLLKNRC